MKSLTGVNLKKNCWVPKPETQWNGDEFHSIN